MKKGLWAYPWFSIPVLIFLNAGLAVSLSLPFGSEILLLNSWRTEPLNTFFRFCTQLGEVPALVVPGVLLLFWRFRFAVLFAFAGLIITPLSYVLKDRIGTDRPLTYFEKEGIRDEVVFVPGVELNSGQTSFPSGHTMAAFGLYGLIALLSYRSVPWMSLAFVWTAILVGFSRIFLVQHFLADVLGGAMVGLLVAVFVWGLNCRVFPRWPALNKGILYYLKKRAGSVTGTSR